MSKISHARHFSKRQSPAPGCTSGAFYTSPKSGDNIDTSQPINIQWDTSLDCFSDQGVDIYLYAPYAPKSMIHGWGGVSYSAGSFQTTLDGRWWNSSSAPIQLQLGFVSSGSPAFMSTVSTGPLFTSTFNSTDYTLKNPTGGGSSTSGASSDASGGGFFETIGNAYKNSGLPKGSIAAAVVVPLIAVAIGIAVYVKFQRAKESEKRKRWSQAVDKRMSTISTDWKGLPPSQQSAAIRQSIAIMRDSRASMARMSQLYGDSEGRPSSTFAVESGQQFAGVGVGAGARKGTGVGLRNPSMGPGQMAARKSAISFAADTQFARSTSDLLKPSGGRTSTDTRPSTETQRGRASRAFHTAVSAHDDMDNLMSPTQMGGPTMVGDRDIRQLELGHDASVAAALNMMHHQDALMPHDPDSDFLMLQHSPTDASNSPITPPSATYLSPTSATPFSTSTPYSPSYGNGNPAPPSPSPALRNPFEGFTRGPSNMMSPDAMLRAYASRDNTSQPGTPMIVAHPASPPPTAHAYPALDAPAQPAPVHDLVPGPPPSLSGRTLYAPGAGARTTVASEGSRYSVVGESDEDAYGGYGHAA